MNSPFNRFFLGPLTIILALVLIHMARQAEWFTVLLALPVGILALCSYWSGLRANILSAIFISAYALYSSNFDLSYTLQVAFIAGSVAFGGGGVIRRWLIESIREAERQRLRANENQSKADFVDNLNGNIETIKEINKELIELANGLPVLPRPEIAKILNRIQNKTANLAQRTVGWHQLAQAKKEVTGDEQTKQDPI